MLDVGEGKKKRKEKGGGHGLKCGPGIHGFLALVLPFTGTTSDNAERVEKAEGREKVFSGECEAD